VARVIPEKWANRITWMILVSAIIVFGIFGAVKSGGFKYAYANYLMDDGWSMDWDGAIRADSPDGVEIVYEERDGVCGPWLKLSDPNKEDPKESEEISEP